MSNFQLCFIIIIMSSIRDFIPLSKLGEGTYSTVYKVRRSTDQQIYALKKVKMNQLSTKEKENALNQIRILASIDSPSIISYKDAFFDEAINVLCIVMEYAGTIRGKFRLRRFAEFYWRGQKTKGTHRIKRDMVRNQEYPGRFRKFAFTRNHASGSKICQRLQS